MSIAITKKWNAWNARGINKLSSSDTGVEITFSLLKGGRRLNEVRNFNINKLGLYSIEHGYYEYEIKYEESIVRVRTAAKAKTIIFEFIPVKKTEGLIIEAEVGGAFSKKCSIRKQDDALNVTVHDKRKYTLFFQGGDGAVDSKKLLWPLDGPIYLVFTPLTNSGRFKKRVSCKSFIDKSKTDYSKILSTDKKDERTVQIAAASANLTTIYIPELKHVATTSSREWSAGPIWGGYVIFNWDCMLSAMLSALESKEIAYENVYAILEQAMENGMIPGGNGKYYTSYDRGLPPVEAYCVLKFYRQFGEKSFLRKCFPYLKGVLNYYKNCCDGNSDGLYEWRSYMPKLSPKKQSDLDKINRLLILGEGANTLQGAKYASGMDNHPVYDDAEYDQKSHTLKMNDIGLNSLLVNTAQCLSIVANILGYKRQATYFLGFASELKQRIQDNLWDEEAGIYKSKTWGGKFVDALAPVNFYPLLGGIPSKKQAQRMIQEHLLNPREFWGKYVIPTIARNHPSFKDQDYWRGRIWGATNFLVFEGLRRYKFAKVAREFANKSHALFMKEFDKTSHVYENFNAITGEGDDVNKVEGKIKCDTYYPWGALLLLHRLDMSKPYKAMPTV